MGKRLYVLDSTLRDGAQGEGISFSVRDKLAVAAALDALGVDYIEAGNPASNPKDEEFFREAATLRFRHARLTAFGSTRRKGISAAEDEGIKSLLSAGTPAVTVFGKAWDLHVAEILKVSPEENLAMIADTVAYLKAQGREVIFDAEHFFDGCKHNPGYALAAIEAAANAGADSVCLCDTNGGCFPDEIEEFTRLAAGRVKCRVGIHTHNDGGMAVANSVAAVKAGATEVQGTLIGIGERCGNANLSAIIANLGLKRGYECLNGEAMTGLTPACRKIAEIANVRLNSSMPYVGKSAFTHKAGMHIDGVSKKPGSFEHVPPESVGNERRFLMSEVAGRSTVVGLVQKFAPELDKNSAITAEIVKKVKDLEYRGYQFEGAEASFELLVRKSLGTYKPFFAIEMFKTIGEQIPGEDLRPATALVKIRVGDSEEISAAEGNGPVNALDKALRKALETFYPGLKEFYLADYKVRILDSRETSSAKTRVLIESGDGKDVWTTVGVSRDIIEASLIALIDAVEYKLIKDGIRP